jgi:hypothetical protein
MLDLIIIKLVILCFCASVYFVLNGFLLIGLGFLGLGVLGFCAVFEEELFR